MYQNDLKLKHQQQMLDNLQGNLDFQKKINNQMKTTMEQMELVHKKNEETERQRRLDDEEKKKEVENKLKEATQAQSDDALQA